MNSSDKIMADEEMIFLPPNYSASEEKVRAECLEHLARIQREAQERAAPFLKILTDIEMRQPPRLFIKKATGQ
jgi:hypothetical protein